jgi:expansin
MLSYFATALAFASTALCAVTPGMSVDERSIVARSLRGQATYYGGNVQGGTCSFSTYTLPAGLLGTALSSSNWDNSGNCGGCVNVRYGGKSVTAMVSPKQPPENQK